MSWNHEPLGPKKQALKRVAHLELARDDETRDSNDDQITRDQPALIDKPQALGLTGNIETSSR